ncbi:hypothetical protein EDD17DRAFT_1503557 [Pisolithus thermaeus]|nr:hypothetical protein EDD17DRAFT_1503557 [Pisolithus thermaeus]
MDDRLKGSVVTHIARTHGKYSRPNVQLHDKVDVVANKNTSYGALIDVTVGGSRFPVELRGSSAVDDGKKDVIRTIVNKEFDVFHEYWTRYTPLVPSILAPGTDGPAMQQTSPVDAEDALVPTLLLWEKIPSTSAFCMSADYAVHFIMDAGEQNAVYALSDFLIFLSGLASNRQRGRITGLAYAVGDHSAVGCLLCDARKFDLSTSLATMFVERKRYGVLGDYAEY